jgi:hypothetical protein
MKLAVAGFCLALATPAGAADMRVVYDRPSTNQAFLQISGEIVVGDFDKFKRIVVRNNLKIGQTTVQLKSPGGVAIEAMAIGEFVRQARWWTFATGDCYSACGLLWLAGVRRAMFDNVDVGFHGVYDGDTLESSSVGNAIVGAYLSRLGYGFSAVIFVTKAPPDKLTRLDSVTAKSLGMSYTLLRSQ